METAFVCDLGALDDAQRARHRELAGRLRPAVTEFVEEEDGYTARLPSAPGRFVEMAEFVELESRCCPFFTLALATSGESGELTLTVTGPAGVKPFIRAEFGIPEREAP